MSNKDQRIRNYKDLLVWQKGLQLVKQIYLLTQSFPAEEKFGLTAQMRRAAVSVPSNIAEGQARQTTGEFVQFLAIAKGSLAELETQLILSAELGFCNEGEAAAVLEVITQLQKMLSSLKSKLTTNH